MRFNASVTYVNDPMYNFWGFNGTPALQNYDLWANKEGACSIRALTATSTASTTTA